MAIFYGSAVLNGPGGSADSPEVFVPRPAATIGTPTVMALPFAAETVDEAWNKQILWHALMRRAGDLQHELRPVSQYAEARKAAIMRLERLAENLEAVDGDSVIRLIDLVG